MCTHNMHTPQMNAKAATSLRACAVHIIKALYSLSFATLHACKISQSCLQCLIGM